MELMKVPALRPWMLAPMIFAGFTSLLIGMGAGLVRLGWWLPGTPGSWLVLHGALMVSGFFGIIIGLERAVGLGRRWALLSPILTALGTLFMIIGGMRRLAPFGVLMGSAALVVVFVAIIRLQPAPFTAIMMAGVLSWMIGNFLWLSGLPVYQFVPWWMGFLILTIVGERLELSRVLAPPGYAIIMLSCLAGILMVVMAVASFHLAIGERLFGFSLVAITLWLLRYDIAPRTIRAKGLARYTAVCLLSGYIWLAVGGIFFLVYGGLRAGFHYDGALHAVFVGFVFSMIFGHALIIFPALLRISLPYRPIFYLPLVILHLSLALRVGGDVFLAIHGRQWGGLLNVLSIVLFFLLLLISALSSQNNNPSSLRPML